MSEFDQGDAEHPISVMTHGAKRVEVVVVDEMLTYMVEQ